MFNLPVIDRDALLNNIVSSEEYDYLNQRVNASNEGVIEYFLLDLVRSIRKYFKCKGFLESSCSLKEVKKKE